MHGDDAPQMTLFPELPIPPDAAEHLARRLRMGVPWRLAVQVLRSIGRRKPRRREPEQLALAWRLRTLETDVDDAFDFPRRQVMAAAAAPRPETKAPVSIFALAAMVKASGLRSRGRFGAASGFTPAPYRVERDGDRTRVVRLRVDETEEWIEKERQRRARQKPPKPVKKAKTRSRKLLALIGESTED
jgi:hypothetical protein